MIADYCRLLIFCQACLQTTSSSLTNKLCDAENINLGSLQAGEIKQNYKGTIDRPLYITLCRPTWEGGMYRVCSIRATISDCYSQPLTA